VSARPLVAPLLAMLDRSEADHRRDLAGAYARATKSTGTRGAPPLRVLSPAEQALAAIRPVVIATPADFYARRDAIDQPPGLNGYLAQEVMNAVDGARTALDLYHHAVAMIREAGTQYYGAVTPDDVLRLLRSAEATKLYRLDGDASRKPQLER
jgi:hypothetical protein